MDDTITLPSDALHLVVTGLFLAPFNTGANWTFDKPLILVEGGACEFYSLILNCAKLCSGVLDKAFHARYICPRIWHMSGAGRSYGIFFPDDVVDAEGNTLDSAGNAKGVIEPAIRQWLASDVEYDRSTALHCRLHPHRTFDCWVQGGQMGWARTMYCGANGIHQVRDLHAFNGHGPKYAADGVTVVVPGFTNPICIEFGKTAAGDYTGGTLDLVDFYQDGGTCEFYNAQVYFNELPFRVEKTPPTGPSLPTRPC